MVGTGRCAEFFVSTLLLVPIFADAQAWVPAKGEGTATLTLQDNFVKNHLGSDGERIDVGHIRSFILAGDIDFGITNKLAVDISIPFVLAKYYGPRPHQLPVDNGNYHGNFQDVRINVRYNLRARPLSITPFVALGVPSNDYIYFAHSAAGTNQREYVFGSSFGRGLEPVLSRAYFQGMYAFLIPQEVRGIRTYRSRVDWDFGYFVTRRFALRTLGGLQIGHSGLQVGDIFKGDYGDFPVRVPSNVTWYHHDQTSRISYLNLGGGASLAITKSWSGFVALTTTVWGRNGHALSLGEVVGLSWNFRTPWARPQALADATDEEQQELYKQNSHGKSAPSHSH
jgi:hypothetical protein